VAKPTAATNPSTLASTPTTNAAATSQVLTQPAATNSPERKSGPLGRLGSSRKGPNQTVVPKRREDWIDIAWALINSEEFLYRH
jgi:hypothetical protein